METTTREAEISDGADYDCIVISDLHLGSDVCQAKLLEEFLNWAVEHCKQLVINGDVFDDLNFKRLTKRHFACLEDHSPQFRPRRFPSGMGSRQPRWTDRHHQPHRRRRDPRRIRL